MSCTRSRIFHSARATQCPPRTHHSTVPEATAAVEAVQMERLMVAKGGGQSAAAEPTAADGQEGPTAADEQEG